MKRGYEKPVVKVIDFQYEEQVAAQSTPPGIEVRPYNPTYCQYLASATPLCTQVVSTDNNPGCDIIDLWSLRSR